MDLNTDQKRQLEQLKASHKQQRAALNPKIRDLSQADERRTQAARQQHRGDREAMRAAAQNIRQKYQASLQPYKEELKALNKTHSQKLKAMLTPEQKKKLKQLKRNVKHREKPERAVEDSRL